jgi:oligopeptidase A
MTNPLLDTTGLPLFGQIAPHHVVPAIDQLLRECDAALERSLGPDVPADYDAMAAVYEVATERLNRAWGAVAHLISVADTPELRAAYNQALPRVTELKTRQASDERLYAKYKLIANAPGAAALSAPRRKALANSMRDFVLAGAELSGAAKARFMQIQERCAEVEQRYSEHVLDATDGFSYFADAAELVGVPADVQQATREAALAVRRGGHKLTLHFPVYLPLMQYAANRALRERMYRAYITRASDLGPPELDNSALMRELLALRQEEAALLGYPSYADVSLVPKMANQPLQVLTFLRAARAPTASATWRNCANSRRANSRCRTFRPGTWLMRARS